MLDCFYTILYAYSNIVVSPQFNLEQNECLLIKQSKILRTKLVETVKTCYTPNHILADFLLLPLLLLFYLFIIIFF